MARIPAALALAYAIVAVIASPAAAAEPRLEFGQASPCLPVYRVPWRSVV